MTYDIKWSDLDPLGHVRHSVYGDYAVDARFKLLRDRGYPLAKFLEVGYAPITLREESRYFLEVLGGDSIVITFQLEGLSQDGSRWLVKHKILRGSDGSKAVSMTVEGSWLDMKSRKIAIPTADLLALNVELPRTQNFRELNSLIFGSS